MKIRYQSCVHAGEMHNDLELRSPMTVQNM